MQINNSHIIITGATGGFGFELIKQLSHYNCTITAVGRNKQILADLQKQYDAKPLALDLMNKEDRKKFTEYTSKYPADILINSAGVLNIEDFANIPQNNIDDVVATNLIGLMSTTRSCLPHMLKKSTKCKIVNIGSIGGDLGLPYFTVYTATKFAVKGFSESLRRELGGTNVGVVLIAPRAMKTPMMDEQAVGLLKAMFSGMDNVEKVVSKTIRAIEKDKNYMRIGIFEQVGGFANRMFPSITDVFFRVITPIMKKHIK